MRAQQRLLRAGGARPDAELVVFEASHGYPTAAVTLGRRLWAQAPSVRSADALGWALTRAGRPAEAIRYAREAMRLGTPEPMFLYHGAIAAEQAGRTELARRWLRRLLSDHAGFSPLHEPRAKRALNAID